MADNKQSCIIHHDSVNKADKLISPVSLESWTTLKNAGYIRQFKALIDIAETLKEDELPNLFYHRQCRCLFTMKRSLEIISKGCVTDDTDNRLQNV